MWTVWCHLQAQYLQRNFSAWANVLCDGDQQTIPQVPPEKTNIFSPFWKINGAMCLMAANRPESISLKENSHQRAIFRLYTKLEQHDGKILGKLSWCDQWSQLLCPRVQTHYHIKVKPCLSPLSFFVQPLVVRHNIFNRALQDYIINKTLASLCLISHTHIHTHSHGLMRAAWMPFDETQLVNEWKTSLLTLYLLIL